MHVLNRCPYCGSKLSVDEFYCQNCNDDGKGLECEKIYSQRNLFWFEIRFLK